MASEDLFGESGSETKLDPEPNGEVTEPPLVAIPVEPEVKESGVGSKEDAAENGAENEVDGEAEGVNGDTRVEDEGEEEEEEEEDRANIHASPREEIKLTVVQYQKAGDDYAFEVLVGGAET